MFEQKLSDKEILARQHAKHAEKRTVPLVVILNHIRSLYNVGSIFRTADGIGIEKLWLCGITGTPGSSRSMISKTALGAEKVVDWGYAWDAVSVARLYKAHGYEIVLLEQIKGSHPYNLYQPKKPVCLVLGNEVEGISDEFLKLCDVPLEIEMAGLKNSLNVSVAFGIVAYDIKHKLSKS
ncbi:MAG: tRNA/rRNA methyltransferase [Candidatus Scalindua sp.]|nr:RNA methyltransferase [Planctomycetota bacterium]GJQ59584.1 MAG: tRNA/rRNA methyltransferase [Candidatus Scalindua sp.]